MEKIKEQTLKENELTSLGDEDMNDSDPENSSIPQQSESETPYAQEFVELTYKGFGFKMGSSVYNSAQLADVAYNLFNLVTKRVLSNEPKDKSYLS